MRHKSNNPLFTYLSALNIPRPQPEYRFHPHRRWRFDYAWVDQQVALEIEGGIWIKTKDGGHGRHNRPVGFTNDMEKYNAAVILGWKVLRVTPEQISNGYAAKLVQPLLQEG